MSNMLRIRRTPMVVTGFRLLLKGLLKAVVQQDRENMLRGLSLDSFYRLL